jgi:putative endonuclease
LQQTKLPVASPACAPRHDSRTPRPFLPERNPTLTTPYEIPARARAARGAWAEHLAEAVLVACGYATLDRRYRIPGGEIDLVVRRGADLVFVEVKARAADGAGEPECFLAEGQRRRVRRAALAWLAAHPQSGGPRLRFDVVAIVHHGPDGGVDIRHLPGAF